MTPVEERIDHEVTKRIAESFADGFMHPDLERDATRLARAYLALSAELEQAQRVGEYNECRSIEAERDASATATERDALLTEYSAREDFISAARVYEATSASFRHGNGADWCDVDLACRNYQRTLDALDEPKETPCQ